MVQTSFSRRDISASLVLLTAVSVVVPISAFMMKGPMQPLNLVPGSRIRRAELSRGPRCAIQKESDDGVQPVVERTRRWVDEFIVGLNICPFAKKPVVDKTVRYCVSDVTDCQSLIQDAWREAAKLLDSDPKDIVTTLMMAPMLKEDVDSFSSMGNWMEDYLEDEDEPIFQGDLTIAVFHPEWTFDGFAEQDPIHYEKRSPFPTISLLRRQDLGAKVKEYMDKGICLSEKIQNENAKSLQKTGYEKLRELLAP